MSKLLATTAAALLLAAPALAGEYHPEVRNCRPDQEAYVKHELGHGRKVIAELGQVDGFLGYLVRWESGSVHAVVAGPVWTGERTEFCTIAWKHVGSDRPAELTATTR